MTATQQHQPTAGTAPDRRPATFGSSVRLVAAREITSRLKSKAFLTMSGILLAVVAVMVVLPNVIDGDGPVSVAVVGEAPPQVDVAAMERPDGEAYFDVVTDDASLAEAKDLLREGDVDAALVFQDGELVVWGYDSRPADAVEAFSAAPAVELVDANAPDEEVLYFVSIIFALAFFMAAVTFGTQITTSVVEEKQTRIVEILLSAVSARALLTGKILGNAALALGQIVALAAVALIGLAATGQRIGLPDLGPAIVWFVPYFALGFLMLAAMFAAAGAMISRSEDVGSVTTPITMLVTIPYLLIFFVNGNELWTRVLSWIPFSAPIAMPVQIYAERAQWWEPIGALVVLAVSTVLIVWLAERVYSSSLLRTGTRVRLRQALSSEG